MRFSILVLLTLSAAAPALAHAPVAAQGAGQQDYTEAWRTYLSAQRTQALEHLRTYTEAQLYPVNDQQIGPLSMLRDANGNPCAMAYLVEQTGGAALIDALVVENNGTRFEDQVAGDPLYEWTLTSGLLLEEAAMVQEPDMFIGNNSLPMPPSLAASETQRLYAHFSLTTQMLEQVGDQTIPLALERLGDRILTAPPQLASTTM